MIPQAIAGLGTIGKGRTQKPSEIEGRGTLVKDRHWDLKTRYRPLLYAMTVLETIVKGRPWHLTRWYALEP